MVAVFRDRLRVSGIEHAHAAHPVSSAHVGHHVKAAACAAGISGKKVFSRKRHSRSRGSPPGIRLLPSFRSLPQIRRSAQLSVINGRRELLVMELRRSLLREARNRREAGNQSCNERELWAVHRAEV